jgi:hypothetical protein
MYILQTIEFDLLYVLFREIFSIPALKSTPKSTNHKEKLHEVGK